MGRRNKKRIALAIAAIAGLAIPMGAALILFLVHGGKHPSTDVPDTPIRQPAAHAGAGPLTLSAHTPPRPAPAVALDTQAGVVFALGDTAPQTAPPATATGDIASGGVPHTGGSGAPGARPRPRSTPSTSGGGASADPTRIAYGPSGGVSGGRSGGDSVAGGGSAGDPGRSDGNTGGDTQDAPGDSDAPAGDAPQRADNADTPPDPNAPDGGTPNTPSTPDDERLAQDTAAPDNAPDAPPATTPDDQTPGNDAPRNQPTTTAALPLDPLLSGAAPQIQALSAAPADRINAVPEPGTLGLALTALVGLGIFCLRQRPAQCAPPGGSHPARSA